MSITALITGRLMKDPEQRAGGNGQPFTRALIAAATDDGSALVSVIAFGSLAEQLAALRRGDTAALTGRAKVNTWAGNDGETRAGLSVVVDGMLTAYHLRQRRKAMQSTAEQEGADQ